MEKKVYIGLLDTRQKKQEDVVHRLKAYTDCTVTDQYSGLADRLTTSLDIRECADDSERFRIDKALWDTGASCSCISERLARKMGLHPVDTGVGISTIGQQDITYYIVDVCLTPEMIFRNIKIAGFPLENHDVDFIIGMDIISKGNLSVTNKNGNTEVKFTI